MIIHSVTPYHFLLPEEAIPQASMKKVGGDYLEGQETPQGFQISRIHSTNPAMYLNSQYTPGALYKEL